MGRLTLHETHLDSSILQWIGQGGVLFHLDAEFNSMEDLVAATFTGRNFGWLPGERAQAIAHVARVVRGDDGTGDLAQQFDGLSFRLLFYGDELCHP